MRWRAGGTSHQLGAVAGARSHIEYRHPWLYADERQKLDGIAPLIGLAVGVATVGRGDDRCTIDDALRRGPPKRCRHYQRRGADDRSAH